MTPESNGKSVTSLPGLLCLKKHFYQTTLCKIKRKRKEEEEDMLVVSTLWLWRQRRSILGRFAGGSLEENGFVSFLLELRNSSLRVRVWLGVENEGQPYVFYWKSCVLFC